MLAVFSGYYGTRRAIFTVSEHDVHTNHKMAVLMGVPNSRLTIIFSAKYQLTAIFSVNSQVTTNFGKLLRGCPRKNR